MPNNSNDDYLEDVAAPKLDTAVDDSQRNDAIAEAQKATGAASHSQEDWSNERRNDFDTRHGT